MWAIGRRVSLAMLCRGVTQTREEEGGSQSRPTKHAPHHHTCRYARRCPSGSMVRGPMYVADSGSPAVTPAAARTTITSPTTMYEVLGQHEWFRKLNHGKMPTWPPGYSSSVRPL